MSMSDCEKCWDTLCSCGWKYRHKTPGATAAFIADILDRREKSEREAILQEAAAISSERP